jgi:hypothetical protein
VLDSRRKGRGSTATFDFECGAPNCKVDGHLVKTGGATDTKSDTVSDMTKAFTINLQHEVKYESGKNS